MNNTFIDRIDRIDRIEHTEVMSDAEKLFISIREYAIYRYVWSLKNHETAKLTAYFLLRTTTENLLSKIDATHEYQDRIIIGADIVELVYIQCTTDSLQDAPKDTRLLLSIRFIAEKNFYICLVKKWNSFSANVVQTDAYYNAIKEL